MTFDLESLQQEGSIWPWLDNNLMADMSFADENYNSDLLDAMADMAYEQEQAMRESDQSEWEGVIHDDDQS